MLASSHIAEQIISDGNARERSSCCTLTGGVGSRGGYPALTATTISTDITVVGVPLTKRSTGGRRLVAVGQRLQRQQAHPECVAKCSLFVGPAQAVREQSLTQQCFDSGIPVDIAGRNSIHGGLAIQLWLHRSHYVALRG